MNLLHEEKLETILDTDELEHTLSELVRKGQITIAEFLAEREVEQSETEHAESGQIEAEEQALEQGVTGQDELRQKQYGQSARAELCAGIAQIE